MIRLEVAKEQEGFRITECVAESVPELAAANLKKMIRTGDIKLNGSLIKKDFAVRDGDIIEIYAPIEYERQPTLDIVYEDENLIVLNKQPGTVVAAGTGLPKNTPELIPMVINYMQDNAEYSEELGMIPFPCFKLDIYTGGLVMFAKNGDYFEAVREATRQRRIARTFRAVVKGCPKYGDGQFQHFYVKESDEKYRVTQNNARGAVPIYTRYHILKSNGKLSFLEIEPVTQYMNQERAHMEAAGYPILGDNIYGDAKLNKKMGVKYQALWATGIRFSTGVNNMLEYLNGLSIETDDVQFPVINWDE